MFQHDNSYAEGAYLTAKQRQVLLTESDRPDWSPALNSAPLSNQQAQAQAGKPPQTAQVFPDAPIGQAGTSLTKPADATGSTVARTVEVTGSGDTLEAART